MKNPLIILFLLLCLKSYSQQINGYVIDNESGEPLIGASVIFGNNHQGTITNQFGFFSFRLTEIDSAQITVSFIGYVSFSGIVKLVKNKPIIVQLTPGIELLDEVEIIYSDKIKQYDGSTRLPLQSLNSFPILGSDSDILKTIQLLPGVQSGKEGSSNLFVRGGTQDQNLIILDNLPLYNVSHLGGFVSVFNTNALKNVNLFKAGFPARYGGRLSSVLNISMKDGNKKEFKGNATLGILYSSATLEGPIKKDSSSFIVSARRFMPDLIAYGINLVSDDVLPNYSFYDINIKLNHTFRAGKLYLSYYGGGDKIRYKYEDDNPDHYLLSESKTYWGSQVFSARYNKVLFKNLFNNFTAYLSSYNYRSENFFTKDEKTKINQYLSGVRDLGIRYDAEVSTFGNSKLLFGTNVVFHTFSPGIFSYFESDSTVANQQEIFALENSAYLENSFRIAHFFNGNIGCRFSQYTVDYMNYKYFEPRILLNFSLKKYWHISGTYSKMHQFEHQLTYSGLGIPADLWMPSTSQLAPESSNQYSLGIQRSIRKGYNISVEGYYKYFDELISLKEGILFYSGTQSWIEKIEAGGIGYSKGLEVLIEKNTGNLTGWFGYTLAKTERKFTNINNGAYYPFKYDRRHAINLVLLYAIRADISLSASWSFGTGYALSVPFQSIRVYESMIKEDQLTEVFLYERKNNFRMEDFHRLDIGAVFTKKKESGNREVRLGIYNVYNRKNPYYYFIKTNSNEESSFSTLYKFSLFPIIPSFSYSFQF
jgi:hypothetical protein